MNAPERRTTANPDYHTDEIREKFGWDPAPKKETPYEEFERLQTEIKACEVRRRLIHRGRKGGRKLTAKKRYKLVWIDVHIENALTRIEELTTIMEKDHDQLRWI